MSQIDALKQPERRANKSSTASPKCLLASPVAAEVTGGRTEGTCLRGLPGIGQNAAGQSIPRAIAAKPEEFQFTPDVLPADILAPGSGDKIPKRFSW